MKKESITLRELTPATMSPNYVKWLNDSQVNQYLESRFMTHTVESATAYVEGMLQSSQDFLFGIFVDGQHAGNIKIGNIDKHHRRGDVGLMIGKEYWGRGVATEAIRQVEAYAFSILHLHKLWAGVYEKNSGSLKAFTKNGWHIVGKLEEHVLLETEYCACYLLEKLNNNS